jgi:hypothetical protein
MWAGKRWREAAEQIELLYGERWREFKPLGDNERRDILRAGVGYVLAEDAIGIGRLREKYVGKMGDGPDKRAFDVVTAPLDSNNGSEFRAVARTLASVDTLVAFLRDLRARYPDVAVSTAPLRQPPAPPVNQKGEPPTTGTVTPRAPVRPSDPAGAAPLPAIPPAVRRTAAR